MRVAEELAGGVFSVLRLDAGERRRELAVAVLRVRQLDVPAAVDADVKMVATVVHVAAAITDRRAGVPLGERVEIG